MSEEDKGLYWFIICLVFSMPIGIVGMANFHFFVGMFMQVTIIFVGVMGWQQLEWETKRSE